MSQRLIPIFGKIQLYQSHLVLHAKELDERNSTISDVRRDLELEVLDLGEDRYSLVSEVEEDITLPRRVVLLRIPASSRVKFRLIVA